MSKMNSRRIADLIWKECVVPAYEIAHEEGFEPEAIDREAALQGIEAILEEHAGVAPDAELEKAREENARKGLELS